MCELYTMFLNKIIISSKTTYNHGYAQSKQIDPQAMCSTTEVTTTTVKVKP